MTSSAASDTERARNRTGCPSVVVRPRQPCSTSTPPLPLPPGRCTSSRTTGGRVRVMTATAESTAGASPTIVTAPPSSALTPDRNIRWSSTRTTSTGFFSGVFTGLLGSGGGGRGRRAGLRGRGGRARRTGLRGRRRRGRRNCGWEGEHDLGAVLEAAHARGPAVALHTAEDGLADTEPVLGHLLELEAGPVVAHEGLDAERAHLEVERDRRLAVPHGVEQGLAHRAA